MTIFLIKDQNGNLKNKIKASPENIHLFLGEGDYFEEFPTPNEELELHVRNAKQHVIAKCDEIRRSFITPIAGQEMVYLTKQKEAQDYLNASDPVLSDYPFIEKEVGITGESGYEVAQVYLNLAAIWVSVGSNLEQIRLNAINEIENATSINEIEVAIDNFNNGLI